MNNRLTALPDEIGMLKRLRKLDLQGNQLASLPETLSGLRSLAELNLRNNALEALPNSISALRRLRFLDLRHKASLLAAGIAELPRLELDLLELSRRAEVAMGQWRPLCRTEKRMTGS
jgi:Leucine-rich repeat (LRR) protein